MTVDLHLVSWNRPKMTELVIRTIHRNTKPENFRLVVLDNGSEQSTKDMLTNFADNGLIDEMFLIDDNMGLEAARQWLLMAATRRDYDRNDYFICVDNDCLPPPIDKDGRDWVERLVELMEKYEDFAAISCRNPVMIGTGNIFEEADLVGDDILEFDHPGGSLRIMLTDVVKGVGGWDRNAPGRGSEETYICAKLHDVGYRTAFAVEIPCLHLFGMRDQTKERWGYAEGLKPEDTGHRDIEHPALTNGDDIKEVAKFTGKELADAYGTASR